MKNIRNDVYVIANISKKEFVYTGINFKEFIDSLHMSINNILLLKANFSGNEYCNNFELVQGDDAIKSLKKANIYSYGDFCFVDYDKAGDVQSLKDEQIAQLLYLAHMFKPFKNVFFDTLNNKFAYLAHDDGFYCKLYCKSIEDFCNIFGEKIKNVIFNRFKLLVFPFELDLNEKLLSLMEKGLYIDIDDAIITDREVRIACYLIGEINNIDALLNSRKKYKKAENLYGYLNYHLNRWEITEKQI